MVFYYCSPSKHIPSLSITSKELKEPEEQRLALQSTRVCSKDALNAKESKQQRGAFLMGKLTDSKREKKIQVSPART